jgi:hypothetical protein
MGAFLKKTGGWLRLFTRVQSLDLNSMPKLERPASFRTTAKLGTMKTKNALDAPLALRADDGNEPIARPPEP